MIAGPYSRLGLALVFVPLYAGPVLAGWGQGGWPLILLFGFVFAAFIGATRRATARGPVQLAALYLANLGVTGLAFACGRGMSALTTPIAVGAEAAFALSVAAALLGVYRYRNAEQMEGMLDSALSAIEQDHLFEDDVGPADRPELAADFDALSDPTLAPARLAEIEQRLATHPDLDHVANLVFRRSDHGPQHLLVALRFFARPEAPDGSLSDADILDLFDEVLEAEPSPELAQAALDFEARWPGQISPEAVAEAARHLNQPQEQP